MAQATPTHSAPARASRPAAARDHGNHDDGLVHNHNWAARDWAEYEGTQAAE
jgi:hypothetical protein